MKKRIFGLILLSVLILTNCSTKAPILLYKDRAEVNPNKLPLRVGLKIENVQAMDGVSIKTPVVPFFSYYSAEFPKGKEGEFLASMIREYCLDSGIFDYTYSFPFKNTDVDIILNLRINKFNLKNNKFVTNAITYGSFVVPMGLTFIAPSIGLYTNAAQLIVPSIIKEKYSAEYDFTAQVLLPNGKKIREYNAYAKGKKTLGQFAAPYADYIYYRSIFKKVFLQAMDDIKGKILSDRDPIIQAYKDYILE